MYKTIVVHIDGSPLQETRLHAAAVLAAEHGAHVVGSAVTGISWMNYALQTGGMGATMIEGDFDVLRDAAKAKLEVFREQARRLGIESIEARLLEDDPRYALLLQSRYADLVVLSQDADTDPALPRQAARLPEFVALHGARPVLVVPDSYRGERLCDAAVVGWDGSMQAIRAIAGALPLLRRAESVKLALINPDALSELHGDEPGADMALYLARHGIKVDIVLERTRSTAGEALMALARDTGAGLMVTGAYGHSRYREWVLGGVTRELLAGAAIPVLFAH